MSGYAKLFSSILDSSVWQESKETRLVWVTMMAMADGNGFVNASVGGLAKRAGCTREETLAALLVFMSPDEDSKSPEHDGRRIEAVEGGWILLNYRKHREKKGNSASPGAERVRKWRARQAELEALQNVTSVTDCHETSRDGCDVTSRHSASASASVFVQGGAGGSDESEPVTEVRAVVKPTLKTERSGTIVGQPQPLVPCPPDLALTEPEFQQLSTGLLMSRAFVDRATPLIRAEQLSSNDRTLEQWRRTLVKCLQSWWQDPKRRSAVLAAEQEAQVAPATPEATKAAHEAAERRKQANRDRIGAAALAEFQKTQGAANG